jgi:hypothetical protein
VFSKFKIPKEFQASHNESIRCIRKDESTDYTYPTPDKVMPLEQYKKLSRADIIKWYSKNPVNTYSIFQEHRILQLRELDKVKRDWFVFLTTVSNKAATPIDIIEKNLYFKVRLLKVREILNPQIACVNVPHPKTKYKYVVAKAYDWNDQGERSRSFNKSIIRLEGDAIKKLFSLYEDLGYEVRTNVKLNPPASAAVKIADMVIAKGGQEFVVEVKPSIESLARFIVAESMWGAYKLKYQMDK